MNVQLFIPCFVDQLYATTGMNTVKLLEKAGCNVSYNSNQTCCGQPAFNAGYLQEACDVSKKFLKDFAGADYIVSPSASCTGYLRSSLQEVITDSNYQSDIQAMQTRVYEISEFLVDVLKITDFGAKLEGVATYHDACGALRECGIKQGPRELLSKVQGLSLAEMNESETCCGFGGTFSVKFEPISIGMAQSKVTNALNTNANYIISTDVSCLMHIDGYIQKNNIPIKPMHLVDVLASGW